MSEWMSDDGTFGAMDTAPEAVRELAERKGYKSIGDFADAYNNAEKKIGVNPDNLVVWDDKDLSSIHERLGKPKTSAEYAIDFKSDVLAKERLEKFKEFAHKELNMSQANFNKLARFEHDAITSILDAQKQADEAAEKEYTDAQAKTIVALKDDWGIKTDEEFRVKIVELKKRAEEIGILKAFEELGLSDNPIALNVVKTIDDNVADTALPVSGSTEEEVKGAARVNEIVNDPAFIDRMHPNHEAIMKEYNTLFGIK